MDGLRGAISRFIGNYDADEYRRALGPASGPSPTEKISLQTTPLRSFKTEEWYTSLPPEEQVKAEYDIASHIHGEVLRIYPRVVRAFYAGIRASDQVEKARGFQAKFGHLPGNPKVDNVDCVAHTQIFTRVASAVGFRIGVVDMPGHMTGVVKVGPDLMVSDVLYPHLMDFESWTAAIDSDKEPMLDHLKRHIPAGKELKDILQTRFIRRSVDAADAKAHDSLATFLSDKGRDEEAVKEQEIAIGLDPGSSIIHRNHASVLAELGRIEESEKHYIKALELNPKHVDAHVGYAIILENRGQNDDLKKAGEHYKRALELDPINPYAHLNYGSFLGNQGDLDGAETHFQITNSLDPDMPGLRKNLELVRRIKSEKK